jgi:hypothetical protein
MMVENAGDKPGDGREWRPVPDPTVLTTEALMREIGALRELMTTLLAGEQRITEEKFRSIDTQFEMVERQRVEQKKDTKDAVDAALAAAKEAVREQTTASERSIAKSETATAEQLKQLGTTFTTAIDSLRRDNDDLKARTGKIESIKEGAKESNATLYAVLGLAIAVITIVVVVVNVITAH